MEDIYFIIDSFAKKIAIEPIFEKRIKEVLILLKRKKIINSSFVLFFNRDNYFQIFINSKVDSKIGHRGIVIDSKFITPDYFSGILKGEHLEWQRKNIFNIYNHYFKRKQLDRGIKSIIIKCQEDKIGVFYYCRNGNKTKDEHKKFVENILSMAAASEFATSKEHSNVKEGVKQILDVNGTATPLTNFYHKLITTCTKVFKAEDASLYLETADGKQLRAVAGTGYGEKWIDEIFYDTSIEKGLTCYVWRHKKPIRWSKFGKELKEEFPTLVMDKGKATNCRSLIAVPINCGNRCVGVLKIENKHRDQGFTEVDQRKLETISQVLAGNLENIRFANNYAEVSYFDVNVFGRHFFEDIFDACKEINEDRNSRGALGGIIQLIKSFAEVLKQAKCNSRDESFEYIMKFNKELCDKMKINKSDSLIRIFERLADVEKALYTIPVYRDHMIHQTQVFLLGFLILAKMKNSFCHEHAALAQRMGFNDNSWIKRWYLASAFHDIGYSFEKVGTWQEMLFQKMLNQSGANTRSEKGTRSIFNWGTVLAEGDIGAHFETLVSHLNILLKQNIKVKRNEKVKFERAIRRAIIKHTLVEPNHATMGALVFLGSSLGDKHSNSEKEMIKDAAVAICLHAVEVASAVAEALKTPGNQTPRIDLSVAPFAFLLAFCDTVQEWGRVNPHTRRTSEDIFGSPRYIETIIKNGATIKLLYNMDNSITNTWITDIFNEHIKSLNKCWNSKGKFKIYYSNNNCERDGKEPSSFMDCLVI